MIWNGQDLSLSLSRFLWRMGKGEVERGGCFWCMMWRAGSLGRNMMLIGGVEMGWVSKWCRKNVGW